MRAAIGPRWGRSWDAYDDSDGTRFHRGIPALQPHPHSAMALQWAREDAEGAAREGHLMDEQQVTPQPVDPDRAAQAADDAKAADDAQAADDAHADPVDTDPVDTDPVDTLESQNRIEDGGKPKMGAHSVTRIEEMFECEELDQGTDESEAGKEAGKEEGDEELSSDERTAHPPGHASDAPPANAAKDASDASDANDDAHADSDNRPTLERPADDNAREDGNAREDDNARDAPPLEATAPVEAAAVSAAAADRRGRRSVLRAATRSISFGRKRRGVAAQAVEGGSAEAFERGSNERGSNERGSTQVNVGTTQGVGQGSAQASHSPSHQAPSKPASKLRSAGRSLSFTRSRSLKEEESQQY